MRRVLLPLVTLLVLTAAPLHAATVTALWDPNPEPDIAGYRISYGTAPGVYTTTIDVGNVTTAPLTLPDGIVYVVVQAYNTTGLVSPYSNEVATGQAVPVPLPAPWIAQDIGAPPLAGTVTLNAGVFTVNGSWVDIWNAADQMAFVGQPWTGDGEITAKVESLSSTDVWAKAGVMIREDVTAGSPNALAYVRGGGNLILSQRLARNGLTTSNSGVATPGTAPYWVRLTRAGNVFTAFRSVDGLAWILLGTTTVPMAVTVQIGLAVSSDAPVTAPTAVFTNVRITSAAVIVPPLPPSSVEPRKFP